MPSDSHEPRPIPTSRPAAGNDDPLAMYALAQWARRSGNLAAADARFDALLARDGSDPVVLAGAANVKIALGDPKAAVDLYRRAIATEPSALLSVSLSQAHGRAIDVEQHARALAAAQSLDARCRERATARLAGSNGAPRGGGAAAAALAAQRLAARDASLAADSSAARSRPACSGVRSGWRHWPSRPPGRSVCRSAAASKRRAVATSAARGCVSSAAPREIRPSPWRRRGAALRRLRRPAAESRAGGLGIRPTGARALLARGTNALGWLLPGLVGRSARRPVLGLGAALCAAGALAFGPGADAVVPDPASVGAAGSIVFGA